MTRGESGFSLFRSLLTGKSCWMRYAPLPSNGWSVAVLFPQDELMADISRLNRTVITMGILGFLFILVVIVWIAGSITRPLRSLSQAVGHIGAGNLDVQLPPVKTRDEVGTLTESFEFMKTSLKRHIAELKETTAAKERIESELKIAHEIQMSILPKTFPPFPHRQEFDIYATLIPAREVGGDLYDFFFLDEDHLCFAIGDVSGKGVSAAFYMAEVKGIVLSLSKICSTPRELLLRANDTLLESLEKNVFISAVYAVLDVSKASLTMARAGHCPVILISGDSSELVKSSGIGLGLTDAFQFEQATEEREIKLKRGDICIFYTDGITEARNAEMEEFGYERLVQIARECRDCSADVMKDKILQSVRTFIGQGAYTDDVTLIVVKWLGNSKE